MDEPRAISQVTNKSLQLTQRQTRMLADMGIDVWYSRQETSPGANRQLTNGSTIPAYGGRDWLL